MGEAKRKAEAPRTYLRMYGLFFKEDHRLAGTLARIQRNAAVFFSRDEAELMQMNNGLEDVTVVDDMHIKRVSKMLKRGAVRNTPAARPAPKREVVETPAMLAAKEQLHRERSFAKFLVDPAWVKTPEALDRFEREAAGFGDRAYWRFLGMLFCGCTNHADRIEQWRRLLTAKRQGRSLNMMTDAERKMYRDMPATLMGWRAHLREGEDYLTYAVNESQKLETAREAKKMGVVRITDYRLHRDDIIAVFMRRGWLEVVVLAPEDAQRLGDVPLPTEAVDVPNEPASV